jgi:CubicO group peptidase (beta-lactamase class C family)
MATLETTQGTVAPGFEPVRDAFEENFRSRDDVGAAFSAYVGGRQVADLWGGEARPGQPWREDTLALSFSVGKGIVALVAQMLADRGQLDVEARVAHYWPEFARNGKEAITVRQVLTHTAGLPTWPEYWNTVSLDRPASYLDLDAITAALAAAPLTWEPGTRFGYHSTTYGWLVGEIVRRITGKTLGGYFHDEVAVPLGLDMYVGAPKAVLDRIALLVPDPTSDSDEVYEMINYRSPIGQVAFIGPEKRFGAAIRDTYNSPEMWQAENPAANPVGDARSLARIYGLLANKGELDGVRLVSPESIDQHTEVVVDEQDSLWGTHFRVGLGYMRSCGWYLMGPNDGFGHAGLGGAVGWADAERNVSFGYVMNRLVLALETDARVVALYEALYDCL